MGGLFDATDRNARKNTLVLKKSAKTFRVDYSLSCGKLYYKNGRVGLPHNTTLLLITIVRSKSICTDFLVALIG